MAKKQVKQKAGRKGKGKGKQGIKAIRPLKVKGSKGPKWSDWIQDTYGRGSALCEEGRTALTYVQILEARGVPAEEIWKAAHLTWKERVVDEADLSSANDVVHHLDNALRDGEDLLTKEEAKAIGTIGVRLSKLEDPDASFTPHLVVWRGKTVIESWEE